MGGDEVVSWEVTELLTGMGKEWISAAGKMDHWVKPPDYQCDPRPHPGMERA